MNIQPQLETHIFNKLVRNEVDIRTAVVKYENPASVLTVCSKSVVVAAEVKLAEWTPAIVQCTDFSRWKRERRWWVCLLGVVNWEGVGVYLVGASV